MNRIAMFVMVLVFPLTFAPQANSQIVSTEPTKADVRKEPKFSISFGLGNGYKLKDKLDDEFNQIAKFNNSLTTSIRLGYALSKYVEIGGERYKISNFVCKDREVTLSATLTSLNLKFGLPITIKGFMLKPYVVKGQGRGKSLAANKYRIIESGQIIREEDQSFGSSVKSSKTSLGVEVELHKNLHMFYELTHWKWKTTLNQEDYSFTHSDTMLGMIVNF